jgi:hypothetical protein
MADKETPEIFGQIERKRDFVTHLIAFVVGAYLGALLMALLKTQKEEMPCQRK